MKRREITISTPSGAKFIVRKSYDGKEVHAIRFEKDDRITEILNNGKQYHEVEGTIIMNCDATGRYSWTLKEMAEFVAEEITANRSNYR